jgi:hypothetical protein
LRCIKDDFSTLNAGGIIGFIDLMLGVITDPSPPSPPLDIALFHDDDDDDDDDDNVRTNSTSFRMLLTKIVNRPWTVVLASFQYRRSVFAVM